MEEAGKRTGPGGPQLPRDRRVGDVLPGFFPQRPEGGVARVVAFFPAFTPGGTMTLTGLLFL